MPGLTEEEIKAVMCAMTCDRGFIINSFSQVECLLADLIDQCRQFGEYEGLTRVIPFSADNRVGAVRAMLYCGPLAPFAERIETVLARFMEFEDIRHLFTHGFASFHLTPKGDCGMHFTRYVPPKKGEDVTLIRGFYRPDTIAKQRESSNAFTEHAMAMFREIYAALGLNPDRLADPA